MQIIYQPFFNKVEYYPEMIAEVFMSFLMNCKAHEKIINVNNLLAFL